MAFVNELFFWLKNRVKKIPPNNFKFNSPGQIRLELNLAQFKPNVKTGKNDKDYMSTRINQNQAGRVILVDMQALSFQVLTLNPENSDSDKKKALVSK